MREEARRFRKRAQQCREMASRVRDKGDRQALNNMADDFDTKAAKIDPAGAGPK